MKEKKDIKYLVKSNNYIGLLFFALVLASLLYILKKEETTFQNIEPTMNEITNLQEQPKEITEPTKEISDLQNYLNTGDPNTFNIYQSHYILNEKITKDNLNNETLLYMAYKYIEKTTDFTNYINYLGCDEAQIIGLDNQITQCGGTKINATTYTINRYITKELLNKTIKKIFNINLTQYTNFYTSEDNLCYYLKDEFLCVSHQTNKITNYGEKKFQKAYKYNNKIEIIEKYHFINNGIYYKGFNSQEIGEGYYKSTFNKINGSYYWESTEYYEIN